MVSTLVFLEWQCLCLPPPPHVHTHIPGVYAKVEQACATKSSSEHATPAPPPPPQQTYMCLFLSPLPQVDKRCLHWDLPVPNSCNCRLTLVRCCVIWNNISQKQFTVEPPVYIIILSTYGSAYIHNRLSYNVHMAAPVYTHREPPVYIILYHLPHIHMAAHIYYI